MSVGWWRAVCKARSWHAQDRRSYAMKSIIPIKWNRPEKIPSFKPAKSGDLEPLREVDKKLPVIEFRDSEELKTANDLVKRLFSLEFAPYKKTVEHFREEYLKEVRRHNLDTMSPEVRVAKMTANIRDMQKYVELRPHDKRTKVRLKELVDKRKSLLKEIRQIDYKLFEWLLEKMNIQYKSFPDPDEYLRVERKRSIRLLTEKHCENIVKSKLDEYQDSLKAEQIGFLEEKIKTLKWIMKEEAECNVPPTVTEEDVRNTEKQLEELKKTKEKEVKNELDLDA
ncbi:28S ribosomal protein S15, mitochondrial [Cimex lectularius]|uniref:Small ribosomal subunit protein uS15m n=1 Tax=Cimex lectularius TaxID=79782 RepID=A0A8I6S796_CIMLE|nr:28S ribosomal protein S15, mitochondrial [Cimex lectularius]